MSIRGTDWWHNDSGWGEPSARSVGRGETRFVIIIWPSAAARDLNYFCHGQPLRRVGRIGTVFVYSHDRKGGGLIFLFLDFVRRGLGPITF